MEENEEGEFKDLKSKPSNKAILFIYLEDVDYAPPTS